MTPKPGLGRVVAVANGTYTTHPQLERAVPDTTDLVELLTSRGFETHLLPDERRGSLLDRIDVVLARRSSRDVPLILLWTGHGDIIDGQLQLMGRSGDGDDCEVALPAELGRWAARTAASQILVVLDCCFSGAAMPDTVTAARAVIDGRADPAAPWFCVVVASHERARSGAMASELRRLLCDGPAGERMRKIWSTYQELIPGDMLVNTLLDEWSEPRHRPNQTNTGHPLPMLPNPLYQPIARSCVVEHLLQAARGTSTAANFFTGRTEVLERIVAWMRAGHHGLCVVTGPAGSGKSAVLGRLVALSVPEERELVASEPVSEQVDPGVASVDANLHLRRVTLKDATDDLAAALGMPAGSGVYEILGLANRRRAEGKPLVVLLDGLDEAGDIECREIALQLVTPLAREALVLLGTREVAGPVGEPGLLALLSPAAETIDLGVNVEETLRDVRLYAIRRLAGVSPVMDAETVADELVSMAREADPAREGPFLLVRLVTSQLRAEPVDTSERGWRGRLASSVEDALEADLRRCVLEVGGREHPTAARELMRALACAHGRGMPADDVWPAVASALSPSGTAYTRDDACSLLLALGRHIVAAAEGDQSVFRVAHQRLIDHLLRVAGGGFLSVLAPVIAQPVAHAIAGLYERLLDEGQSPWQHAYLWRHAWSHLADAGSEGIDLLRGFVARDRDAFLPDLALATMSASRLSLSAGHAREAASLVEEAAEISRELDDEVMAAAALCQLAIARAMAGDLEEADKAGEEAERVLRRLKDSPDRRPLLADALIAMALSQLRQGIPRGALSLSKEAIRLLEEDAADGDEYSDAIARVCTIAGGAAISLGDLEQADAMTQHALEQLQEGADEAVLLDALSARAQVELLIAMAAAERGDEPPVATAGVRILELHRRRHATGTIADVTMAEGLRTLALTPRISPSGDSAVPDPRTLLDQAIELAEPFASDSCDATISFALSLTTRAIYTDSDSASTTADLASAEAALRQFASTSPLAAAELAVVITTTTQPLLTGENVDLTAAIERQTEAVDLLAGALARRAQIVRTRALHQLYVLLARAGRGDEALVALETAVDGLRELLDGSLDTALRLAVALCDLSVAVSNTRPLEAVEFATEGLELLDGIDRPGLDAVRGQAYLAIGAGSQALGEYAHVREAFEAAVTLLDSAAAAPVMGRVLAIALSNLALILADSGDAEPALAAATRAAALLDEHGPGDFQLLVPVTQLSVGCALLASGEESEAEAYLDPAIQELVAFARVDPQYIGLVALAVNSAGNAVWEVVSAELADRPELIQILTIARIRPLAELEATVVEIQRELEHVIGGPAQARQIRQLARQQRSRDPDRFDAAWKAAGEDIPSWLPISVSLSHAAISWWNTSSWRQSHDYLLANPALLDPATDILLEELRGEFGDDRVDAHLRLRSDAAAHGVDDAYAPELAELLLDEWLATGLDDGFLTQRYNDLVGSDVAEVLAARVAAGDEIAVVAQAILVLARRGEEIMAYRVATDPAFGVTLLQPAWRSVDVERLGALATLCRAGSEADSPEGPLAAVATAIAEALTGHRDAALADARDAVATVSDEGLRASLLEAVTDALAHHPDQSGILVELLQELRTDDPELPKPNAPQPVGD
ncbi:MAG: caspase family protein [Solirubrobacteraceae bacterium]